MSVRHFLLIVASAITWCGPARLAVSGRVQCLVGARRLVRRRVAVPVVVDAIREEIRTMSEVEQEVSTFKVDYRCDHCPDGVMRPTGIVYDDVPPLYPHYCTSCGHTSTFPHRYPRIVTRTKDANKSDGM
jgi:hypothetical protein